MIALNNNFKKEMNCKMKINILKILYNRMKRKKYLNTKYKEIRNKRNSFLYKLGIRNWKFYTLKNKEFKKD